MSNHVYTGSDLPQRTDMNPREYHYILDIIPMGKPRQTQQDKWKKRPVVMRYRAFVDELRSKVGKVPDGISIVSWEAYFPIPASWSKKKKAKMKGKPHQQVPDRDNIDKAILDALFKQDSVIYGGSLYKFWDDGYGARIELTMRLIL